MRTLMQKIFFIKHMRNTIFFFTANYTVASAKSNQPIQSKMNCNILSFTRETTLKMSYFTLIIVQIYYFKNTFY